MKLNNKRIEVLKIALLVYEKHNSIRNLGMTKQEFQFCVIENDLDSFSNEKIDYLFKELNIDHYVKSKFDYTI